MSGPKYQAFGNNTLASAQDTCLTVIGNASTPRRAWTYELIFADEGTPADNVLLWTVQRATAEGTATEVVPTRLDIADAEASANVGENHSAEPTYTSTEELLEFSLNTRATFRWVAAPGGELIAPATASAGWGAGTLHASATTDVGVQASWLE